MSSPIGDALRNPAIKPPSDMSNPTTLQRGANSLLKGSARNFDTLSNIGDIPGRALGLLLKRFLPSDLKKSLDSFDDEPGFIEGQLKKGGLVKDLPRAESYKDRLAEGIGNTLSDLPMSTAPFANPAMKTLGNYLATAGGAAAQTFGAPKVEEMAPNNPYVQIPANIALGLGGALGGGITGKALSRGNKSVMPEMTAGQAAPFKSDESRRLLSKQLDLAKKDPKSAKILSEIQENQQNKVANQLDFPDSTTGEEIVDEIQNAFENIKQERGAEYRQDLENSMEGLKQDVPVRYDTKTGKPILSPEYKEITLDKTGDLIDELRRKAPVGGETDKMLTSIADDIMKQKGDPWRLNGLKKELADKTEYSPLSGLYLGSSKKSVLNRIIHSVKEEMNEQIPGYSQVLSNYENKTKALEKLQKGVVGDYVKSGDKNPSDVIKKIFENPNKHVAEEFKSIMSPELYDKAAQTYLKEIVQDTVGKASINQENKFNQFYKLREHLENNGQALAHTLPENYQDIINDTISKIKTSERGIPRNDFTVNAGRGIGVGDEVKGLGTGLGLSKKILGKIGGNYLNREEMMTGVSPLGQIGKGVKHVGKHAATQGNIARNLSEDELPNQQNEIIKPAPVIPENITPNNMGNDNDVNDFMNFVEFMPEHDIEGKEPENNEVDDFMNFSANMKKGRK